MIGDRINLLLLSALLAPCSLLAAPEAASPGTAATRASEPLGFSSLLQLTLGMLVVLSVLLGLAWLLRRSGRFQNAGQMQLRILGGLSVGTRERLVLVQVGTTQLLIGVATGSITPLHVLNKPLDEAGGSVDDAAGFPGHLARTLERGQPV